MGNLHVHPTHPPTPGTHTHSQCCSKLTDCQHRDRTHTYNSFFEAHFIFPKTRDLGSPKSSTKKTEFTFLYNVKLQQSITSMHLHNDISFLVLITPHHISTRLLGYLCQYYTGDIINSSIYNLLEISTPKKKLIYIHMHI